MATVPGASGVSAVSQISQLSSDNARIAQTLVEGISTINGGAQVSGNTLTPTSTLATTGTTVLALGGSLPTDLGPIDVGTLQPNVVAVLINNTNTTSLANSRFSANETVVAGTGGLNFVDNGAFTVVNVGGGTNADTMAGIGGTFSGDGTNTILVQTANLGVASTILGTSASADTITGAPGSTGGIFYKDGGGSALINPTGGNVTVFGGSGGTETVFGGTTFINGTIVTAPAFTGSLTVTDGTGYFAGGTAGNNFIASSTVGGSTLLGGGANDTLQAGGPNDQLYAGSGISTLDGSNSVGHDTLVASNSAVTYMFGSKSEGDTFFFGNSSAAGVGFQGTFIAAHTAPNSGSVVDNLNTDVSNTFVIGSGTEYGTVYDFISGVDKVSISAAQGGFAIIAPTGAGVPYQLETSTGTTISFLTKITTSDITKT